ncbi:MAG: bifunctional glutamate N-acetyltransferase/amino-acid acetyltransferase ArgJ [Myxococcota bacterium]|jgi:glutamate N-acetyltransferase/amino-acid N-acetyltransferase|nr:bifunctional glutamate N-acetyltransferase/amino-acid acetyltransferase ArgJ [Myxococcota bacterium]
MAAKTRKPRNDIARHHPAPLRVPGFRYAGVHCGVKAKAGDLDLALIESEVPAAAAAVFTRSTVVGAPVEWSREIAKSGRARAIVANSGVSNVAMGARGRRDAAAMAAATAKALGCTAKEVFVASTGVIGEPLPMAKIRSGITKASSELDSGGLRAASEAIRTTDTFAKFACERALVARKNVRLAGIAKGSGMIEPDMATMLSFLVTDVAATPSYLRGALKRVVDQTYNRVTVDGEGSTSDSVVLLANGTAGNPVLRSVSSPGAKRFETALLDVAEELARMLARDGEGATKLVTVNVTGAANPAEAERAARRIANSMLVKTAIFGRDPNWGRILQTIGAGRIRLALPRVEVKLCGVSVFKGGASAGTAARKRAERGLEQDEVEISVHLGAGRSSARIWTCDLSYDYVRINAEYTT